MKKLMTWAMLAAAAGIPAIAWAATSGFSCCPLCP
jgi:hypothetical protein